MARMTKQPSVQLKRLTPKQRAALPGHFAKWCEIELGTQPVCRSLAERAIRACYRLSGLKAPKQIFWSLSPMATSVIGAHYAGTAFTPPDDKPFKVSDLAEITNGPRRALLLPDLIMSERHVHIYEAVHRDVIQALDARICPPLRDEVSRTFNAGVAAFSFSYPDLAIEIHARGGPSGGAWSRYLGGHFWANWVAYERFFTQVCGVRLNKKDTMRADAYATLTQHCGSFFPDQEFAIATERPEVVNVQGNRLHSTTGPALKYPDDWRIYALQGVHVPREWIEQTDKLDVRQALVHPNVEQRRVLREMLGWETILKRCGGTARPVNAHPDPEIGTLLELDLREPGERPARFLMMRCGTGRTLIERVDPSVATAMQAQEWRLGLNSGEYKPELRT